MTANQILADMERYVAFIEREKGRKPASLALTRKQLRKLQDAGHDTSRYRGIPIVRAEGR